MSELTDEDRILKIIKRKTKDSDYVSIFQIKISSVKKYPEYYNKMNIQKILNKLEKNGLIIKKDDNYRLINSEIFSNDKKIEKVRKRRTKKEIEDGVILNLSSEKPLENET